MEHELKILPQYFMEVAQGKKPFELRSKNELKVLMKIIGLDSDDVIKSLSSIKF